tara:strand:- start:399 stop:965 length:567 start_codon:yes stop_codon:yes gene_type:complete
MVKDLEHIIKIRRAVYPNMYTGKKISKNLIEKVIENSNYAPTHKLTQPWFFKVFSNDSKKTLANKMVSLYKDEKKNIINSRLEKIIQKCEKSEYILCICMKRSSNEIIPEWEEIAATAMAVQNIWLSCASKDIGCYWSSPSYINKIDDFLKLNSNERCLGFFYMGHYIHSNIKQSPRISIKEKIEWFN